MDIEEYGSNMKKVIKQERSSEESRLEIRRMDSGSVLQMKPGKDVKGYQRERICRKISGWSN